MVDPNSPLLKNRPDKLNLSVIRNIYDPPSPINSITNDGLVFFDDNKYVINKPKYKFKKDGTDVFMCENGLCYYDIPDLDSPKFKYLYNGYNNYILEFEKNLPKMNIKAFNYNINNLSGRKDVMNKLELYKKKITNKKKEDGPVIFRRPFGKLIGIRTPKTMTNRIQAIISFNDTTTLYFVDSIEKIKNSYYLWIRDESNSILCYYYSLKNMNIPKIPEIPIYNEEQNNSNYVMKIESISCKLYFYCVVNGKKIYYDNGCIRLYGNEYIFYNFECTCHISPEMVNKWRNVLKNEENYHFIN